MMKVEVNYRWLLCLLSFVIMFLLREHTRWLSVYVICCAVVLIIYGVVWPRFARYRYESLKLQTLKSTSDETLEACELALRQTRWLRKSPYAFGFWDLSAVIASRRGETAQAIEYWHRALKEAPLTEVKRIRANLNQLHAEE